MRGEGEGTLMLARIGWAAFGALRAFLILNGHGGARQNA
jgi:hypothetical protein